MKAEQNAARIIAVLILVQMAGGLMVNFALPGPAFAAPGFLVNAAPHAARLGLAALLGIASGAIFIGIAIAAWPVFKPRSEAMALGYLALATAGFALSAVENTTVLSLLSLSQAYATAAIADAARFEIARSVVAAARNWAHFVNLIVAGMGFLLFYGTLLRFALVPRVLAGFGVLAALLQITVVARPLFGLPVIFPLLAPLGLALLALSMWLLVKGFRDATPRHAG